MRYHPTHPEILKGPVRKNQVSAIDSPANISLVLQEMQLKDEQPTMS
jgi:hypothetical protein